MNGPSSRLVKLPSVFWLLVLSGTLLVAAFQGPVWLGANDIGNARIRWTIRLAVPLYAAVLNLLWIAHPIDRAAKTSLGRTARLLWTTACIIYVVHVGLAFHYAHDWSHARAMAHTEEVSGFGPGIFVSHLFTLLWIADAASWWLWPEWHAQRSRWIDRVLHSYMLFIVFNGTIVFESGAARVLGVAIFVELSLWVWWTWPTPRTQTPSQS